MFHNLCIRITTSALLLTSSTILIGCSSSERQTSPTADSATEAPAAQTATPRPNTGSSSGMKVFIDPKTGEMRAPTDAERAAMERAAPQDGKLQASEPRKETEVKLRDGGTAVFLDSNPEAPMQGCVDADGNVTVDHNCQNKQQKQDPEGGKP